MKIKNQKVILIFLLFKIVLWAQVPTFSVTDLEGTAKVQHAALHLWDKISVDDQIRSNDIIETNFQTKIVLQCTKNCVVIIGSNSKALIDYKVNEINDTPRVSLSVTIFNGGVLINVRNGSHANVFTANAIAESDSGTVSAVADGKTGESGFQVINGSVSVRNLTQNNGKVLRSGLTTMILPNKEPTAALYMTNRHVSVLKHFFGEEYIQKELDLSGIKPTEEKTGRRLSFSQKFSTNQTNSDNNDTYRALFSTEKIYGSIITDQLNNSHGYQTFFPDKNVGKRKGFVELGSVNKANDNKIFSSYMLNLGYSHKFIDLGLRFSVAVHGYSSYPKINFTTFQAVADKLEHLTIGDQSDSLFVHLGAIKELTLGNGLIVNNFQNNNPNCIDNPLGLLEMARFSEIISLKSFINDITAPEIGGFFVTFEPSMYYLNAGYYFDLNQKKTTITNSNYIYSPPLLLDSVKAGSRNAPVHIYELDFGTDIAVNYDFTAKLFFEFAQKLNSGNDGIVIRMPSFLFDFYRTKLGLSFTMETGRLLLNQFDQFYVAQGSFIETNKFTGVKTVESQNSVLSPQRRTVGLSLFYNVNPFKGTDIAFSYRQNIKEKKTFILATENRDSSTTANRDYSYSFRLALNDTLLRYVRYFALYVNQNHVSLFPQDGSLFLSWNTEIGVELQTIPFFNKYALEAGFRYFYLDNGNYSQNFINKKDRIVEGYLGIKWGVL